MSRQERWFPLPFFVFFSNFMIGGVFGRARGVSWFKWSGLRWQICLRLDMKRILLDVLLLSISLWHYLIQHRTGDSMLCASLDGHGLRILDGTECMDDSIWWIPLFDICSATFLCYWLHCLSIRSLQRLWYRKAAVWLSMAEAFGFRSLHTCMKLAHRTMAWKQWK